MKPSLVLPLMLVVWAMVASPTSLASGQELTLGGNSLLGWRGTF